MFGGRNMFCEAAKLRVNEYEYFPHKSFTFAIC